jgi:GNAT superfamily N-acetyltransferase
MYSRAGLVLLSGCGVRDSRTREVTVLQEIATVIPTEILIRKADEHDRADLESCFYELQSFEASVEPNRAQPALIRSSYIERLYADCERTGGAIFLAETANRVLGFVCVLSQVESEDIIERDRLYAYVIDLFVEEPYRRIGVGSKLMQVAEAHAKSCSATRIRVGVLVANSGAHELYCRLGYHDQEIVLEKTLESRIGGELHAKD